MSVFLKSKNAAKAGTSSNIFTSFNSTTQSCLFMKQLTFTCISTVLHRRKILPDDCFESKNFEGMNLKLLKSGAKYVGGIEKWLEGAFEAIEKQYLKHLMLDIQDAQSNMALEIYTMTYTYHKRNDSLSCILSVDSNTGGPTEFTTGSTKLTTIKLLQMFYTITQTYTKLPRQVTLAMRLSYHEGTPTDYQPSGFMEWEDIEPLFPDIARSTEIGVTATQYHHFKLINKSCFNDKFFKDLKNIEQNNSSVSSPEESNIIKHIDGYATVKRKLRFDNSDPNIHPALQIKQRDAPMEDISASNADFIEMTQRKINIAQNTEKREIFSVTETTAMGTFAKSTLQEDFRGERVRCPCMSLQKSDIMFSCLLCKSSVHAECFGILKFDSSKKLRFCCHLCHQDNSELKCHDRVMNNLKNSSDQQKLAVLRRVLKFVYTPAIRKITLKKMEKIAGPNCPKSAVEIVLKKMIEIGVTVPQGKKKNYLINKDQLLIKLPLYFYKLHSSSSSQTQEKAVSISMNQDLLKRKSNTDGNCMVMTKCRKSTTK